MKILLTSLIIGILSVSSLIAQSNLQSINQSLRYSRYARIALKVIPVQESDRVFQLNMMAEKIEDNAQFDDYEFSYAVVSSFQQDITEDMKIILDEDHLKDNTDSHFYFEENIKVPENQDEAYVVFLARDTRQGDEYVYHLDIISSFVQAHPNFSAHYGNNLPFDQNFLNVEESLLFKTGEGVNLFSFYYPYKFSVPLPPMETKPAPVPKEVPVENEGGFLANVPKTFGNEGYYFIQSDTGSIAGLLIKTVSKTFPRVSTWEEMVDMVTYISTRKEHQTLLEAENKKLALDQYWINMTKSEDTAKKLIKEYFRQVEFANILFTDYKDGWATDRGMVYIVMGPPQEVFFNKDRETWIYLSRDSNSKITFTFARVKNILTPNHYQLNRSRTYQPEWFKSITAWRNGRMAF